MGALSSIRDNQDTLAVQAANVYLIELKEIGITGKYLEDGDIEIIHNIDLDKGYVMYGLRGNLGKKINDPDMKVQIPTDLLRGLKRGNKAYERHIKNIPTGEEMTQLVKVAYTTLMLLSIGEKYNDAVCKVIEQGDKKDYKMNSKIKKITSKIKDLKDIDVNNE